MTYYKDCALVGRVTCEWSNPEYNVYVARKQTLARRVYANVAKPVLFDEAGTRIFEMLQSHGYASQIITLLSSVVEQSAAFGVGDVVHSTTEGPLSFGDISVNDMLRSAARNDRSREHLTMSDIVAVYQYHDRFDHLSAFELFDALKRVPAAIVCNNSAFFVECIKYVCHQYDMELRRSLHTIVYQRRESSRGLTAMLRLLRIEGDVRAERQVIAYRAPLFIDQRGRDIFQYFAFTVFMRDIVPALHSLPMWAFERLRVSYASQANVSADARNHTTLSALVLAIDRMVMYCKTECIFEQFHVDQCESQNAEIRGAYRMLMQRGQAISAIPFSYCVSRANVSFECTRLRKKYRNVVALSSNGEQHHGLMCALDHQQTLRGNMRLREPGLASTKLEAVRLSYYRQLRSVIDRHTDAGSREIWIRTTLPSWEYALATMREFIQRFFNA